MVLLLANLSLFTCHVASSLNAQNLTNQYQQIHQKIDVKFKDGKTIQLSDFIFYAKHAKPKVWWSNETLAKPTYLMVKKGDYWKTIDLKEIKTIEYYPIEKNYEWKDAIIILNKGDTLTGKIPVKPNLTWVNGDEFRFSGVENVTLNGNEDIRTTDIKLFKIKSVERTQDNKYILTDKNGTEHNFNSNLKFISYGQNKVQFFRYSTIEHIGTTIHMKINKKEKIVDIKDIRTIFFEADASVVRIIMNDATELKASPKYPIYNLFGKIEANKIWFGPIKDSIVSINFN